jgi:hypothetical protein
VRKGEQYDYAGQQAAGNGTIEAPSGEYLRRFRTEMASEIPGLAAYIDNALVLRDRPSLGATFSDDTLELPQVEDYDGPGGGIVLSADPMQFVRTGLPSSKFDRALHFWLTENEVEALALEISKGHKEAPAGGPEEDMSLLARVVASEFGGLVVLPEEVPRLAHQCTALKKGSPDKEGQAATDKLLSLCRSAAHYHLGMYIPGQ